MRYEVPITIPYYSRTQGHEADTALQEVEMLRVAGAQKSGSRLFAHKRRQLSTTTAESGMLPMLLPL
jgi:hypothetical protein